MLFDHCCPMFPVQLHYLRLPKDISEDYVMLMDSTVSTGAAALMAVRVLLVSSTLFYLILLLLSSRIFSC